MHPPVQLSQIAQWVKELFVRCWEPRKSLMKMYFAGSYKESDMNVHRVRARYLHVRR
jgi:hypothetical protein